ncbi:hypothetical protein GCK32_016490 [Trichostrongylus colubriformis]|uniref:Uncharacterized protein n=1 Tax=Trichostrongylus colubriformis TaxID=6319 RepID=A0AAN8FIM2_TRICO
MKDNTKIQTIKSASEADGHLNCVIRQPKKVETNEELKKYDLGESYHILFARGPFNKTDDKGIQYHGKYGRFVAREVSLMDVTVHESSEHPKGPFSLLDDCKGVFCFRVSRSGSGIGIRAMNFYATIVTWILTYWLLM